MAEKLFLIQKIRLGHKRPRVAPVSVPELAAVVNLDPKSPVADMITAANEMGFLVLTELVRLKLAPQEQ